LDTIDASIDELYDLLADKKTGFGVIRIPDMYGPIVEYHTTVESIRKLNTNQNLIIVTVEDHIKRTVIRKVCYDRYNKLICN